MDTLYVTDLDGTLLDGNARLPRQTEDILRPLLRSGLPVTVCTARSWISARTLVDRLGVTLPVILYNGGFVYDPVGEKALYSRYYDREKARELVALFQGDGHDPLVYSLDERGENHVYYHPYRNPAQKRYIESRLTQGDSRFRMEGRDGTWRDEQPFYVNAIGSREALAVTYEKLRGRPDLNLIFSEDIYSPGYWWLEVVDSRVHKGAGVEWLRRRFKPRRVVCFGDNMNDLLMFQRADVAVAVANACPEARAAADIVIGTAESGAVARWIEADAGAVHT